MTAKPPYVVNELSEKDVTVDWFFGPGHLGVKLRQSVLLALAWFFAVLPEVITASALLNRDDPTSGWWHYQEGYALWDRTIYFLGIIVVVFIIGFFILHVMHRTSLKRRNKVHTYDQERLALRLDIAEAWYADKYGPQELRREQRRIQIEPYADIETYELRGLYRSNGVE